MTYSNHFLRLRTHREILDPAYLSYWLRYQFQCGTFKGLCRQWVNQATVRRDSLLQLLIPLAPLAHQRKAAKMLDQVDELRAKRRQAIALLDDLNQSIFIDIFGHPATNPKGWPIRTIDDLVESATYGTGQKAATTGDLPVLRMGNITSSGRVDLSDLKYMQRVAIGDRYLVHPGDILFNRTNSADLVGKTAVYRDGPPVAYAGYLVRVRTNHNGQPEYLSAFLNSGYGKRVLRGMCKSIVGMANINARELKKIRIPAPPVNLQEEFARRIQGIENIRSSHEAQLLKLDELFNSLQQRAFRGEL